MQTFTFRGAGGDLRTVTADNEDDARDKAMRLKWGPPEGIYAPKYKGYGLTLVS